MSETAVSTLSDLTISLYKKVYTYCLHSYLLYSFLRPLLICFHIEDLVNRPASFIRQPSWIEHKDTIKVFHCRSTLRCCCLQSSSLGHLHNPNMYLLSCTSICVYNNAQLQDLASSTLVHEPFLASRYWVGHYAGHGLGRIRSYSAPQNVCRKGCHWGF
ncbi:hypothetical protein IG631_07158 [Alternaria alternata]|nr:hypothetical protein IG631_07158 [Alternaria alternata]